MQKLFGSYYQDGSISYDMMVRGFLSSFMGMQRIMDWDSIIVRLLLYGRKSESQKQLDFYVKLRDFYDRCIKTDTGWTITLGRGLDMFEKYNTYSIASSRQDMRKCKEFMVTFMKE